MTKPQELIAKHFKVLVTAAALALVVLLGIVDLVTGPYFTLLIFYLIPLYLTAWYVGKWAGFLTSALSAAMWFIDDVTESSFAHPILPYWNVAMKFGFFMFVTHIMSELKSTLARERELARIDPLTCVANSRLFYELIDIEIHRTRRYRRPFTLVYMDIDDFKMVNDSLGHHAGDALLRLVADTIKSKIRVNDIVARLGGDEFVILFPETGSKQAQVVLRRVQKGVSDIVLKNRFPVTLSIGALTCIAQPLSTDTIIKIADQLMYSVKRNGKNDIKYEILNAPSSTA